MRNQYTKRFEDLKQQMDDLLASKKSMFDPLTERNHIEIEGPAFLEWKVKAKNLLSRACGTDSEHYKAFGERENPGMYGTYLGSLGDLRAVFLAAFEDFAGGHLRSVRSLVQAEVFDSELEQARALLGAGYKAPAAVVAGVVLETSLRELCDRAGLSHDKLDKMNADLAKNGTYNKLQQKRITALADIRNSAAHGSSAAFSDRDVEDMIRDVERFVAEQL